MSFDLPQRRIATRQVQTQKRNVPLEQILAVQGQNPLATGIETAGNALGQVLAKKADLIRQGQQLAQQKNNDLQEMALKHQYDLEMQQAKGHEETPESYTLAGTDQQGNIIQIGNKSGKTRVIPVPGGGTLFPKNESALSPENAGKLTMLELAKNDLKDVEGMVFDKDGTPNYSLIAAANAPFGGLPFTKGRDLNSLIENSIAAKLRAETGATANESEVKSIARRFKPTVRDGKETIKNKLGRLQQFMTSAVEAADPRGTRRAAMNGGLKPIQPRQPTVITPRKVGRFQIEVE